MTEIGSDPPKYFHRSNYRCYSLRWHSVSYQSSDHQKGYRQEKEAT